MFHKVACFHFDGIANHSDVIYVCFELEMSLDWDIGGGPTLLGAAKPYGEFIYCIPFLTVQQIGSRITLLWGCSMLLFWLPNILLLQRWNKIDIKTLHIAFTSSSAALSTWTEELRHTWYHYRLQHFSSPHEDYFDLMPMIIAHFITSAEGVMFWVQFVCLFNGAIHEKRVACFSWSSGMSVVWDMWEPIKFWKKSKNWSE